MNSRIVLSPKSNFELKLYERTLSWPSKHIVRPRTLRRCQMHAKKSDLSAILRYLQKTWLYFCLHQKITIQEKFLHKNKCLFIISISTRRRKMPSTSPTLFSRSDKWATCPKFCIFGFSLFHLFGASSPCEVADGSNRSCLPNCSPLKFPGGYFFEDVDGITPMEGDV